MFNLPSPQPRLKQTGFKQQGAVLILMAFIIGLAATSYFVKSLATIAAQSQQEENTYHALFEAKKALLGWAESHPNHPGQLPFPDRNNDNNYDGNSDCNSPGSTFSYAFLMGQLPVIGQTNPCVAPQTGLGQDFVDAYGNRLWYAVSRNVVHKYETAVTEPAQLVDPIINPDFIDNPVFPWLKVLDANGNILSNRVAAVIIAPNSPLGSQNRASGIAGPNHYLDSLILNGLAISNADYTRADEDFIIAPNSSHYSASPTGPQYQQPYQFNDQLTYITIDELVTATTRRAASEAKSLLNRYHASNGVFPASAQLGASLDAHDAIAGNTAGMLPIDVTNTCQCTSEQSCSCGFNLVQSVTFTRGSSTSFISKTGLCEMNGTRCTCAGAGSCSSASNTFQCNASGDCTHNISGASNRYDYTVHEFLDTPSVPAEPNACTLVSQKARCYGSAAMAGEGRFNIGLKEATWFKRNRWQDYFYYVWSSANAIQLGTESGISALLVGVGKPIVSELGVAQTRPSHDITHYLDSNQNVSGTLTFDARNKQKTTQYNDQLFIVAP